MNRQRRGRRRGFTLMMLLVTLVLLGVFALVAGEVFSNSMRALRTSGEIQNQLNSFEGLLARLREDVWSAKSVRVDEPRKAVLTGSGGGGITWTISGTGEFVRTAGADVCRWRKFDIPLAFASHPVGLLLQQGDQPEASFALQSQFFALERSRP